MRDEMELRSRSGSARLLPAAGALLLAAACSEGGERGTRAPEPQGPFRSVTVAANDPAKFVQPLAGVPLSGDRTALVAFRTPDGSGAVLEPAVFLASPAGAVEVLHAGAPLAMPLDIDVSSDGAEVLVADRTSGDDGLGAILTFAIEGGAPGAPLASGFGPASVTVGPDGAVYFSGRDPATGAPGVFRSEAGSDATPVFVGPPLVDPSGIAVFDDGRLLVADTSLFENGDVDSDAGVILIEGGRATVFASGFETGYPAGIALTVDGSTLVVSGQGSDDRDKVYLIDVASRATSVVEGEFSAEQLSSGGLKRDRATNRFVWSSGAHRGGTVYTIEG